jgi:hypothetical protein
MTSVLCSSSSSFLNKVLAKPQQEVRRGYFVISNSVVEENRDIRILLNQEYFTEEYLRGLSRELFDKYPEPDRLDVTLYSNIEQVRGFVDGRPFHPAEQILDTRDPTRSERYAHGLLFRSNGNEVIRYYVPGGNDTNLRTVVIKGCDPAYSSCN